jgi:hypothetical protein
MLAHGQVPTDDYDPESDDETLSARRIRLIPVKVERIPIACGQEPYILHLCRELEEELALHKMLCYVRNSISLGYSEAARLVTCRSYLPGSTI